MIPLVVSAKNLSREFLILALVSAINASGGLNIVSEEVPSDLQSGSQITAEDILLAYSQTRDSPYENQWTEIVGDENLQAMILVDYDIFAFKYVDDAEFFINKPEYVEQ